MEYGTRVVKKRDSGTIYPVYGGGGATFFLDTFNRENRVIVARFGMSATCTRYVTGKFYLNDSGLTFSPKNPNELLSNFLDYFILSINNKIFALGRGSAQKNLNVQALSELTIRYPTAIKEQRRIVAILDEAFEAIATAKANTEKNLQNARELFGSTREETLSYTCGSVTSLRKEVELLVGFAFKSSGYVEKGNSVRLLRGDNIVQGHMRWDGAKHWPVADVANYVNFMLREGDVVLAMDRPWVKAGLKRAFLTSEDIPALLVQRTACLRCGPRLSNRYLYHVVSSERFLSHLLESQTGIGVPHVSGRQIGNFTFNLPSIAEQSRTVEILDTLQDETRRLEDLLVDKDAALEELKRSLLHQAFSGALTAKAADRELAQVT